MKTSIPRIRTIRPKKFEMSDVQNHLSRSICGFTSRQTSSPMIGYALVTFHDDGSCGVSWHVGRVNKFLATDLPTVVANRLKREIWKQ